MWYWYNASDLLEDIEEIIDSQKSPTSKGIEISDCIRTYKEEHGLLSKPIKGQKLEPDIIIDIQGNNGEWDAMFRFLKQEHLDDFMHMPKDKFLKKYADVTSEKYKEYKILAKKLF